MDMFCGKGGLMLSRPAWLYCCPSRSEPRLEEQELQHRRLLLGFDLLLVQTCGRILLHSRPSYCSTATYSILHCTDLDGNILLLLHPLVTVWASSSHLAILLEEQEWRQDPRHFSGCLDHLLLRRFERFSVVHLQLEAGWVLLLT